MKIVIASKNKAKFDAVREYFFNFLGEKGCEFLPIDVESGVSSKPINYEVFCGASNRIKNACLLVQADFYIALEGGFFEYSGEHFVGTVAQIFDKKNDSNFIGLSDFCKIPNSSFECVKNGLSLNEIIVKLENLSQNSKEYKQTYGVMGFLTNGKVDRKQEAIQALTKTSKQFFAKIMFDEREDCLSKMIEQNIIKQENLQKLTNENYEKLDKCCTESLQNLNEEKEN